MRPSPLEVDPSPVDLLYSDPCFRLYLWRRRIEDPEDIIQETAIRLLSDPPPPEIDHRAACFVRLKDAVSARHKKMKATKRKGTVAIEDLSPSRKGMLG